MINNFSDDSRKSIAHARTIAGKYNYDHISSVHLLVGILSLQDGVFRDILTDIGINTDTLTSDAEKLLTEQGVKVTSDALPFTPGVKKVIESSFREMERCKDVACDTVHLVMGMLKEKDDEAGKFLIAGGINYKIVSSLYQKIVNTLPENEKNEPTEKAVKSTMKKEDGVLQFFGRDLNQLAREGKLDPVIGRDKEIERMIHILCRKTKNNPMILGESGTGKTALVDGLAQRIVAKKVPLKLKDKKIIMLSLNSLVAGTRYRGEFEKRIQAVIDETKNDKNIIIFIDELHTLAGGVGAAEGGLDASNIIKPALSRGELQCIGATTLDEYQKYFEHDSALNRRFQKIKVEEPSDADTIEILMGIKKNFENYHNVSFTKEGIEHIVSLSKKFIIDRKFPDKGIDVLDEVGAKMSLTRKDVGLVELEKEIDLLNKEKEEAVAAQDFEKAGQLKDKVNALEKKKTKTSELPPVKITKDDIRMVVGSITGVPVEKINTDLDDAKRFLAMEDGLNKIVINQGQSIHKIANVIKRAKAGVKDSSRPSVLMFVGQSGVGKTYVAKKLSEFMFGDEKKMVYIDCAELSEPHSVSKLIGSPPGFVGFGDSSKFEQIRQNPYSILLLDECEKSHKDIWNIFLRIFEEGEIVDSKNRTVSFKHCIIILTSNIGSALFTKKNRIGFEDNTSENSNSEDLAKKVRDEVKNYFRPELLNRLDEIIVFNSLCTQDLEEIARLEIKKLEKRLAERELTIQVNDNAIKFLVQKAKDEANGAALNARPIRRVIESSIEIEICNHVLNFGNCIDKIVISVKKDVLDFKVIKKKTAECCGKSSDKTEEVSV